ncbi:MAG: hypothetical protein PHS04_06840 [Tissierellia bacterium]|nr:hypothetical protein [Tissierellia bacterium]
MQNKNIFIMGERKVKNEESKVLLTQSGEGKLKVIAGEQDGSIKIATHPKQEQPDFEKPFMGVVFTDQDKEQFQKTEYDGRVFDFKPVIGGEKVPSLISLGKLINRFLTVPLKDIYIPQTFKMPLCPIYNDNNLTKNSELNREKGRNREHLKPVNLVKYGFIPNNDVQLSCKNFDKLCNKESAYVKLKLVIRLIS